MWQKSLTSIGLLVSSCASLAFNGYQLEVIVFSNVTPSTMASETWSRPSAPNFSPVILPEGVEPVAREDFTLNEAQDHLTRGGFRTLLHAAWRLTYAQLNKYTTLPLYGGRLFDEQGNIQQTVTDESYPYQVGQQWELNGRLQIRMGQYFETRFNTALAIPKTTAERFGVKDLDQAYLYLLLNESRKVKSKELNYMDHPVYGLIYKIVPVNT